jgi:Lrp/AsnC family transcriptional regulator for asnA, asnC and gidA
LPPSQNINLTQNLIYRPSLYNEHAVYTLMPAPLTQLDRDIIAHLQEDGRRAIVTIARETGVTEKTVRAHVKQLVEQDTIHIVALTSPGALGYSVAAMAAIRISSTRHSEAVFSALVDIDAIPEITEVEIFPYFSLYYQQARIIDWGESNDEKAPGVTDTELSEADKAIVAELNLDGRQSFNAIAEKLQVSESQVRTRVQHMQATQQIKIMAIANPFKLLNRSMAWVLVKADSGMSLTRLAERFAAVPKVSYVAICAGQVDFFIEVICTSERDLMTTIDSDIRSIEGVSTTETYIYLDLLYKRLKPFQFRNMNGLETTY